MLLIFNILVIEVAILMIFKVRKCINLSAFPIHPRKRARTTTVTSCVEVHTGSQTNVER